MIILLRGHIRNSFDNDNLYNLFKELSKDNNISIYIHTWNIIQNSLSWRWIDENNSLVTNELIINYFRDLSPLIKNIIIDDDKNIKLIGNLNGTIINTSCPIKGWKNLWYGNFKNMNIIKSQNNDLKEVILNIRFDIFSNSFPSSFEEIINFININKNNNFERNVFILNDLKQGVDNIFIGNIETMNHLLNNLYYNLDHILEKFKFLNIHHQEHYVYYENCFPKNFNLHFYRIYNNLHNFSEQDLIRHYINHGQYENRICKTPDGFNFDVYRILNNVNDWNDGQIAWHWINHGVHQGWDYKLTDDFNFQVYREANNVYDWNDSEIIWHWLNHGRHQGWTYK
jgi:hypothetical protein